LWVIVTASLIYSAANFIFRNPSADISGFTGMRLDTLKSNLWSNYQVTEGNFLVIRLTSLGINYDFRLVFGIVFPAITGLIAGTFLVEVNLDS
jgi:hypothetical protein